MMKKTYLLLFLIIGLLACTTKKEKTSKLDIAKKYYQILNNSKKSEIVSIINDTIIIRESEADYEEVISKKEYVELLKWDAISQPVYKTLNIKEENGNITSKISKIDKRIAFLHDEPMVWNEIITFKNNKIEKIERIKYDVFNVDKFVKRRDSLLKWVDEKHPELKSYLHDQTEQGGMKYLKAIELYKKNK